MGGMEDNMQISIGYHIANSHVAEKRALAEAFELVKKARESGAKMRVWIHETQLETQYLLARVRKDGALTAAMKSWEVACLESKIVNGLRNYMNDTSEMMNNLRPLNPPLRTDQLKPFMEAMTSDRTITIQKMDLLTRAVADLTAYKLNQQIA